MAYNYAAYGTAYGQYAGQTSTMNTQQQSSTAGYPYGQTAASAYGVGASATTTTTQSAGTQGYGNTASVTTTAANAYNYAYNYNYAGGASNYNTGTAQANAMQAFQQSWYANSSTPSAATTQQTATTAQAATAQQQAYGQYLQQYQQQMSAYQQYANAGNAAASTAGKSDGQAQQKTGWGAYNQMQQQRSQQANDYSKTGWGNYQQTKMGTGTQQSQSNQQKSTGVVYRTPMKYSTDTQQYTGSNVSQSYNQNQSYKSATQPNSAQQTSYSASATTYNHGYNSGNQSYGNNQSAGANSMQSRQPSQQQQQQYGQRNLNNMPNYGQNQGYQQNQGGQNMGNYNMQNRGGYSGSPGNMNIRGGQQHGGVRQLMTQRSPMSGGNNMGGGFGGNMGPTRDGSSIPPFPRAWHGQDQSGPRSFKDQKDRWGGPGPRGPGGFNPNQQHQNRMMYNNNMRNPKGSNRELWSPAQKPKPLMSNDGKSPLSKNEEIEKIDKEKHPEIKSYLYAWLGARHSRPTYDIRQVGERPNIMFRCDLRVEKYSFVGVGKATSKKEAQTLAAWKFGEYLVKIGEIQDSDLPSKQQAGTVSEEMEGDIGDVNEQNDAGGSSPQRRARKEDDFRNRGRDRRGRGGSGPGNRGRGGRRGNPPPNWGGPPMGQDMTGEIQPLMAVQVGPWGSPSGPMGPPMGGPPRMMGPPPPLMDFGPPYWDEGWGRPPMGMGPPHMGPPMGMRPPYMRRSQNDFWRRRDIEERMMDLSRGASDWAHPEDMFISQMIRNQQEGERRQRGQRGVSGLETAAIPGEWERVQQQARPVITSDDRHVMAKHAEIYPQEGELKHLHRVVNTVEQALKLLSDKFVDEDHPKEEAKKTDDEEKKSEDENKDENIEKDESTGKKEKEEEGEKENEEKESTEEKIEEKVDADEEKKDEEPKKEEKRAKIKILKRPKKTPKVVDTRPRVLCGVNRVGPLAKGLLITKDSQVNLVLLCGEIPTTKLLDRIMEHIEDKLAEVDGDLKVVVERKEEEAGFLVKTQDDDSSKVEVSVKLTAMALRKQQEKKNAKKAEEKEEQDGEETGGEKEESTVEEPPTEPDPVGILPKAKMLEALACLRHTHWFQAKACMLQSCVILTRILRDLQRRDEEWNVISEWGLEVLIHNCLTSSEEQMSPGDACRRFFEVVAGGILLPDMPGITDPCERSLQRDILDYLSAQQREDLTKKAQKYLRNLAFREIHLILGMDKLPSKENHPISKANAKNADATGEQEAEEKDKVGELNNLRKRRFEANGSDGVAESPKRSLTDEEDTDAQQNMAELCISDENSEGKVTGEETTAGAEEKSITTKETDAMDVSEPVPELTKEEEDALLEEEDERMDT